MIPAGQPVQTSHAQADPRPLIPLPRCSRRSRRSSAWRSTWRTTFASSAPTSRTAWRASPPPPPTPPTAVLTVATPSCRRRSRWISAPPRPPPSPSRYSALCCDAGALYAAPSHLVCSTEGVYKTPTRAAPHVEPPEFGNSMASSETGERLRIAPSLLGREVSMPLPCV
jgi:hypothetical protein